MTGKAVCSGKYCQGWGCSTVRTLNLACTKPQAWSPALCKLGMAAHTCNPSTWEVAGGKSTQGHPQLHREFEASLCYVRFSDVFIENMERCQWAWVTYWVTSSWQEALACVQSEMKFLDNSIQVSYIQYTYVYIATCVRALCISTVFSYLCMCML